MMYAFFAAVVLCAVLARWHPCCFWLSAAALFLFAALRYGFGNDYFSYYRCFLEIRLMGENPFPGEGLYTALNRIMPHYFWLIAVTSFVFVCVLYGFIRKNVPVRRAWMSIALLLLNPYLFLMHLSAIRQSLALVCFICAVPFACRKKPVPYCLMIAAACGFHNSAVILFPVYFIANFRPVSRKQTLYIAVLTVFLLLLGHLLYRFLDASLALLRLERYQHSLSDGLHNSLRATLLSSVAYFYLLWNLPRLRGKTLMYAKLWLIGSTLSVLAYRMAMLTRVEMYFDMFSIVALPRILVRPRKDDRLYGMLSNFVFPALILLILLLRYYSFFTNPEWVHFFTYQTIFEA